MPDYQHISKAKIKLVRMLNMRKVRKLHAAFTAEGTKCVLDTLPLFKLRMLIATDKWIENNLPAGIPSELIWAARAQEMEQMSHLNTAPDVIAVYDIPPSNIPSLSELKGQLTLMLDGIQDPGNLGTIIRCADWFGINNIIASPDTVDVFNTKTVQSTMGAICRVNVCYTPLEDFIKYAADIPVYGTLLTGESIYSAPLPEEAIIVMGNEGNGISPAVRSLLTHALLIPSYPPQRQCVESLNVAMATAITLSQFRSSNG